MSTTLGPPRFDFDNSYARDLEGFYAAWEPVPVAEPQLVRLNRELADELGLDADTLAAPAGVAVLAGNAVPEGASPLAQAYAGHQFGGFSPQLGDGRAVLLGEVVDRAGRRRDLALKGSGRTPFSRGGDGRAALGPVLREYLLGEAMAALGIPTTRALAAVRTGEAVQRDETLPGAVLTRVAASHVRVGTFQFFAARQQWDKVGQLAEYVIERHYPDLAGRDDRYLGLLAAVSERQAALVASWMGVGFIHGVMNTDNMTISGETIDYGPCAFLEAYDPATVFSSIDHGGRYAYGNQPAIAQWNLARFAETLVPLMGDDQDAAIALATEELHRFAERYQAHRLAVFGAKLGLRAPGADGDEALIDDYLELLGRQRVDFTLGFRTLARAVDGDDAELAVVFGDGSPDGLADWLARWRLRLGPAPDVEAMNRANPWYLARNHLVEQALSAAVERDDLGPFDRLLAAVRSPWDERPGDEDLTRPAPAEVTAGYRTFCGT